MWRISMTVIFMTWKQGWIYGRIWMRFQWSMEHSLRHFTRWCGSFILWMRSTPSGIMWSGVVLLYWYGLVFEPNWKIIKFLQTQSYCIAGVLDLYGKHSWWIGCYWPRMTSSYITGTKSMLTQIWSWRDHWWILNVIHVEYLKVCHTIKNKKSLILFSLQLMLGWETE